MKNLEKGKVNPFRVYWFLFTKAKIVWESVFKGSNSVNLIHYHQTLPSRSQIKNYKLLKTFLPWNLQFVDFINNDKSRILIWHKSCATLTLKKISNCQDEFFLLSYFDDSTYVSVAFTRDVTWNIHNPTCFHTYHESESGSAHMSPIFWLKVFSTYGLQSFL